MHGAVCAAAGTPRTRIHQKCEMAANEVDAINEIDATSNERDFFFLCLRCWLIHSQNDGQFMEQGHMVFSLLIVCSMRF